MTMRTLTRIGMGFAFLAAGSWASLQAEDAPPSPQGTVRIAVLTPDAKPLAGAAVRLWPVGRDLDSKQELKNPIDARTDANGTVELKFDSCVVAFRVMAPGVGFGLTGNVEILPEQTVQAALAPLARFGEIRGRVAKEALGYKMTARICEGPRWNDTEAKVLADGSFVLENVTPGVRIVQVDAPHTRNQAVEVQPGRAATVEIIPVPPPKPVASSPGRDTMPWRQPELSLSGRVIDANGHPVIGAKVYCVNKYFGGIRMYEQELVGVTDSAGRYEIAGIKDGFSGSIALAAWREGRPLGFAQASLGALDRLHAFMADANNGSAIPPSGLTAIRISDAKAGASLDVRVLRGGQPIGNASVIAAPEDWHTFFSPGWAAGRDRGEFARLLMPVRRTDDSGTAHFDNLLPGRYTIWAVDDAGRDATEAQRDDQLRHQINWPFWRESRPAGRLEGVALAAGGRRRASVTLVEAGPHMTLRILAPDGRPRAKYYPALNWSPAPNDEGCCSGRETDGNGLFKMNDFASFGLWRMRARTRQVKLNVCDVTESPFMEATAYVALSPLLADEPVELFPPSPRPGATVRVQLQDEAGKPLPGTVVSENPSHPPDFATTTGPDGVATFTDVPTGLWPRTLKAYADLPGPPDLDANMPDRLLENVYVLPDAKADLKPGPTPHAELTIRRTPAGYVRGRIKLAKDDKLEDMGLCVVAGQSEQVRLVVDQATGRFVAGPILGDKATCYLTRIGEAFGNRGQFQVDLKPGRVVTFDPTPEPPKPQPQPDKVALTMGGLVLTGGGAAASGQVLAADGKTPVWAARVLEFRKAIASPCQGAWSDANGSFRVHGLEYAAASPNEDTDPPGSPAGTVLLAMVPGSVGAAVVPLQDGKPARVVLPKPLSVAGMVTVGGKAGASWAARGSQVHVLAAHRGAGKLDPHLSIRTTAAPDGSFSLDGLSRLPCGKYVVQAALDDIWLSPAVPLDLPADANAAAAPVTLAIPAPSRSVVLEIVRQGKAPLADTELTVDSPVGPMTDAVRPKSLRTDGRGKVLLSGLPAGDNTVRIAGVAGKFTVRVPPIGGAGPSELRLVLPAQ